jgi:hypothetical protein
MSEEQMRILKMIEDQKISAADGAQLLNALTSASAARAQADAARQQAEAARRGGGGWGWGGPPPPVPPAAPGAPVPPVPPAPPAFDPFDFAFGRGRRDEGRDREGRRRRRDTESLDSETPKSGPHRMIRIRVTEGERTAVNVNLPVGLVNFGLSLANRYLPEDAGIDLQSIADAVQQGAIGKIIDIQENDEHDEPKSRVEISVE